MEQAASVFFIPASLPLSFLFPTIPLDGPVKILLLPSRLK